MSMHAESMPGDMCVAAVAPLQHVCSDEQDIMSVGANHPKNATHISPCTTYTLNAPKCRQMILPMSVYKRLQCFRTAVQLHGSSFHQHIQCILP